VVSGKFVILTGILHAAKIGKFNACQCKASGVMGKHRVTQTEQKQTIKKWDY